MTSLLNKNRLLPPILNKPASSQSNKQILKKNLIKFKEQLDNQSKNLYERPFDSLVNKINTYANTINVGRGLPTTQTIVSNINLLYTEYSDFYNQLLSDPRYTNDPANLLPDYGEERDENELIKRYNREVLQRLDKEEEIPIDFIPISFREKLPEGYLNTLDAYNSFIQQSKIPGFNASFIFDRNKLLLSTLPKPKPVQQREVPTGFTEIGVNTFFKKLEGQLKNNYSDMMGEYIVPGSNKPCKLYMDKNYNYVVVQGDQRQVFKDPIKARTFCLLGGFEADKVQQFRSSKMVSKKLQKPFRVVPRVGV